MRASDFYDLLLGKSWDNEHGPYRNNVQKLSQLLGEKKYYLLQKLTGWRVEKINTSEPALLRYLMGLIVEGK
jgi:hypothetical protein